MRWRIMIAMAVSVVALVCLFSGCGSGKTLLVQGSEPSAVGGASPGSELVIVTFNVQDLYFAGKDRQRRMRLIGRTLAKLDPDVVGIQEAFIDNDREMLLEQLKDSRLTNYAYFDYGRVGSGLMILSAFPILSTDFHEFENKGKWYKFWQGDYFAGKGVGLTCISIDGHQLEFYNTHAQASYHKDGEKDEYSSVRFEQMKEIRDYLKKISKPGNPAILLGDLNCSEAMKEYEFLVKEAGLVRMLDVATDWDHVFGLRKPGWQYSASPTQLLTTAETDSGEVIRMSDHDGYMTTVAIRKRKNQ